MITKRLEEYIEFKNITYRTFEKSIGSSPGRIAGAVRENRSINSNLLEKITSFYTDLNPVWLLTGKDEMILSNDAPVNVQTKPVPLYDGKTLKSLSSLLNNSLAPIDYIWIPSLPACDGAIKIKGHSANPLLKSGDIIFYKKSNKILSGQIHLISVNVDGEEHISIKVLRHGLKPGTVFLEDLDKSNSKEIQNNQIIAFTLVKGSVSAHTII